MASIVLGIGCSHTPQLHTPAEQWDIRAQRDRSGDVPLWWHGERLTYEEVERRRRDENLRPQTAMAVRAKRLRKAQRAISTLAKAYAACRPDVTIIFGNDQREIFLDGDRPAFAIMGAREFVNRPRSEAQISRLPPGIAIADRGHLPDEVIRLPGHPGLARHIGAWLSGHAVDFAVLDEQVVADPDIAPTSGIPHAYGFIHKQIMRDVVTPQVPIDTNTVFADSVPLVTRCFEFGCQVGEAVAAWNDEARVCIVASGGLSHFVVDEAFDRDIMDAMTKNDFGRLLAYGERYYQAGSSEIRSWIAAGGALSVAALQGRVVDYQPLYRTAAGTGSSAAFMLWR